MEEKLWSDCSEEERKEVNEISKRIKRLNKYLKAGYLSAKGYEYFRKELEKEINKIEKKYSERNSTDRNT